MRFTFIILILAVASGCSSPPLANFFGDQAKPLSAAAADVKRLAQSIQIHAMAPHPDVSAITVEANELIAISNDLRDLTADVDKAQQACAKLRTELVAARDAGRTSRGWVWTMFSVGGGLAVIVGFVLMRVDNGKTGVTVIVAGVVAIALGVLLPMLITVTDTLTEIVRWVMILGAIVFGGLGLWIAVKSRRLKALVDNRADTTWQHPDGEVTVSIGEPTV